MKILVILLFAISAALAAAKPVYACASFLCLGDILGFTDAGKQAVELGDRDAQRQENMAAVTAQKDETVARITADQAKEVARITQEGQERLALAQSQIERERAQGLVSAIDAAGKYKVLSDSINAMRDVKLMQLYGETQIQVEALRQRSTPAPSSDQSPDFSLTIALVLLALACTALVAQRRQGEGPVKRGQPYRIAESQADYPIVIARKQEVSRYENQRTK